MSKYLGDTGEPRSIPTLKHSQAENAAGIMKEIICTVENTNEL